MLRALFPSTVITVTAGSAMDGAALLPGEAALASRMVGPRRREFAAGRAAARSALEALGVPAAPILADERRVPLWPEGVVGSITHCPGYTGAAVARSADVVALGADAEVAEPLPADLVAEICSASELRSAPSPRALPGWAWPRLVFSAKECAFKCSFPLARIELAFHEVTVAAGPDAGTLIVRLPGPVAARLGAGTELSCRYLITSRFIATGITIPAR